MALGPRLFSRTILRGYASQLAQAGLLSDVLNDASIELAAVLLDPNRAPAWVDGALFDELHGAVARCRGREAVWGLGLEMMKSGGLAAVLTPIIRFALEFVGKRPDALFANLQSLASVISKGTELTWVSSDNSAGTIRIRSDEPVPDVSWASWEGAFSYAFDLTETKGSVQRARPGADGCSCEIRVEWT